MFTIDTLGAGASRVGGYEEDPNHALAALAECAPDKLDRNYIGRRRAGQPIVVVVSASGTESWLGSTPSEFDWGCPSREGRRLAHALLVDLTGRNPPPAIRDALACEALAHLRWSDFSLTARDLLGWIESRGYTIGDWPLVESTPNSSVGRDVAAAAPRVSTPTRVSRRAWRVGRRAGAAAPRLAWGESR